MAKPQKNTFDDVKMLIATLSVTMTLIFWHLFSASAANAQGQVAVANIPQAGSNVEPMIVSNQQTTSPGLTGKILLGGQAPQQQVVVIQRAKPAGNNNGNNNGGGGGNVVTQTKSS